jgi:hypothetical protein
MENLQVVNVGKSKLDSRNNVISVQVQTIPTEDDQDVQDLGQVPVWLPAGMAVNPGPNHQGLYDPILHAVVGFRSTATADVYGVMREGDVAFFSSGPNHRARIFLKEATDEITLMTKTGDGKDAYATLNGSEGKFQISIKGVGFEMSEDVFKLLVPGGFIELSADGNLKLAANTQIGPGPVYLGVSVGPAGPANVVSTSVAVSL